MQDKIVQEVESTRENIAEHHGYDVKRIAAYLRERAAAHREEYEAGRSREPEERDRIE